MGAKPRPSRSPERLALASWAADCAQRVLPIFEADRPTDLRPQQTLDTVRAFVSGDVDYAAVRAAAVLAHAAARDTDDPAARAAARALGHAAATPHSASHADGASIYALRAIELARGPDAARRERDWQGAARRRLEIPGAPQLGGVDDYLATLPPAQKRALQVLRGQIRAAAPDAEECVSYRLPAFRRGKLLVAFGATRSHCALYVLSGTVLAAFEAELAAWDHSKGTIRFSPETPIPGSLVRRIVRARMAENASVSTRRSRGDRPRRG